MIKRYFAGANTSNGFNSKFKEIVAEPTRNKVVYIIGSSGSGKSTLMKHLAKGKEASILPCASDITSADLVILHNENTVIVDATSPHMQMPEYPSAIGVVFDTAKYLDRQKLLPNKLALMELNAKKATHYKNMYCFLNAAHGAYLAKNNVAYNQGLLARIASDIYNDYMKNQPAITPRHAFCSWLGEAGYTSLLDMCDAEKKVCIHSSLDAPFFELMQLLALKNTKNAHIYRSAFVPEHIEAITTGNISICKSRTDTCDYMIDLDVLLGVSANPTHKKMQESLILQASAEMAQAKSAHQELEKYYGQAMDFDGMMMAGERFASDQT